MWWIIFGGLGFLGIAAVLIVALGIAAVGAFFYSALGVLGVVAAFLSLLAILTRRLQIFWTLIAVALVFLGLRFALTDVFVMSVKEKKNQAMSQAARQNLIDSGKMGSYQVAKGLPLYVGDEDGVKYDHDLLEVLKVKFQREAVTINDISYWLVILPLKDASGKYKDGAYDGSSEAYYVLAEDIEKYRHTTPVSDTVGPVVSDFYIEYYDDGRALVKYKTNEPAEVIFKFGEKAADKKFYSPYQGAPNSEYRKDHSHMVDGLKEGKIYFYSFQARDTAGNVSKSGLETFSTPGAGVVSPQKGRAGKPGSPTYADTYQVVLTPADFHQQGRDKWVAEFSRQASRQVTDVVTGTANPKGTLVYLNNVLVGNRAGEVPFVSAGTNQILIMGRSGQRPNFTGDKIVVYLKR